MELLLWAGLFVLWASVLSYITANWSTPGDAEPTKPRSIASAKDLTKRYRLVEGGVLAEVLPGEFVISKTYGSVCATSSECTVGFAGFTHLPDKPTNKKCNYCGRPHATYTCPHCGGYAK